ncbi:MAG TPA: alpha/beta fold hydrolase [Burkholderiales bacterium]|nr:alpha/beta fold hydrolase [Burkholderiales bacterium]
MRHEPYAAPPWLPGGHAQTLYAPLLGGGDDIAYRRERWDTPDGDFIDLDWSEGGSSGPWVVLFHGLEGNSRSHYALALMRELQARGWGGVVAHFRGCSGEPNRLPRAYHSGDSAEIGWVLGRLRGRLAGPLFAAGVSLGGNALLKWLGEQAEAAAALVTAAAAVSAPLDLTLSGDALARGLNRVYTWHFLASLRPKGLAKLGPHPGLYDRRAVARASTLREFDNLVTAPVHGFRDTDDYWTRASSKPLIGRIHVPTLVLNARNDPFVPPPCLPAPQDAGPGVILEFPDEGGHVGFVTGPFPGNIRWLPRRVLDFFADTLPGG